MLGPLPTLHRLTVAASIVTLSAVVGLWLGVSPDVPVVAPVATLAALVAGALVAWFVVHEHHDDGGATR